MNEANFAYLKDQLRYLGVDDMVDKELRENLEAPRNFTITSGKDFGRDAIGAILRFKKSAESDLVFFTSYTTWLAGQSDESRQQTFRVKAMDGITLEQAYNLLSGRAVLGKRIDGEQEGKPVWMQLDFAKKDVHGNYKIHEYKHDIALYVEATARLRLFPAAPAAVKLFHRDLHQGNIHSCFFLHEGKEAKLYVQYDPSGKQLILFDEHKQRMSAEQTTTFMRPSLESLLPKKGAKQNKKGLGI